MSFMGNGADEGLEEELVSLRLRHISTLGKSWDDVVALFVVVVAVKIRQFSEVASC